MTIITSYPSKTTTTAVMLQRSRGSRGRCFRMGGGGRRGGACRSGEGSSMTKEQEEEEEEEDFVVEARLSGIGRLFCR